MKLQQQNSICYSIDTGARHCTVVSLIGNTFNEKIQFHFDILVRNQVIIQFFKVEYSSLILNQFPQNINTQIFVYIFFWLILSIQQKHTHTDICAKNDQYCIPIREVTILNTNTTIFQVQVKIKLEKYRKYYLSKCHVQYFFNSL